jgi:hypothetical protein
MILRPGNDAEKRFWVGEKKGYICERIKCTPLVEIPPYLGG